MFRVRCFPLRKLFLSKFSSFSMAQSLEFKVNFLLYFVLFYCYYVNIALFTSFIRNTLCSLCCVGPLCFASLGSLQHTFFRRCLKPIVFSTSLCNYIVLGVTTMVTLYASWGFILRNIFVGVALGVCFCCLGFILLFTDDLTWF